jgi:hypothetical protein
MSCNIYEPIECCVNSVNGVKRVTIFKFGDVFGYKYENDILTYISDYQILNIGVEYCTNDNSTFNEIIERGNSDKYLQKLSITLPKLDHETIKKLFKLIRANVTIIIKDLNDKCWLMGQETPARISEYSASTTEFNGYSISFESVSKYPIKEIKCFDSQCAISVFGGEVRQSTFIINSASTYDFSGEYELLGDDITRNFTPAIGLEPLLWTNPAIYNRDLGTLQNLINPNGFTIIENMLYDSGSDIVLITFTSEDTSYPNMSINGQLLTANVYIAVNLQTTYSTSLSNVTISVTDESLVELYNLPAADAVVGTGLSGIASNSFIDVSDLYPSGQTFTISVQFDGENCSFAEYQYVYEPSNVCELSNSYTLHNGKHYSIEVDKLLDAPTYREIAVNIGEYSFILYKNIADYHSNFTTFESDLLNELTYYPDLEISNIQILETATKWSLSFDAIDDNLDFYITTRGNDATNILDADIKEVRKFLSNRSTVLALQTICPSDSYLTIKNISRTDEILGDYSTYPDVVIDARIEDVPPFTNNITRSLGIDINEWQETDTITVENESISCPDVLNSFNIETCLDEIEYTNLKHYYLFSMFDGNLGNSFEFDTNIGVFTINTATDIVSDDYSDFSDALKQNTNIENANIQYDALTKTFYIELILLKTITINVFTALDLSTDFVEERHLDLYNLEVTQKQHPDIGIDITFDTFLNPTNNLTGVVKDYANLDNRISKLYGDFQYISVSDIFEVNFTYNFAGYTIDFFYSYPSGSPIYTMTIPTSTFNDSVSLFSTLIIVANIRYIRVRNGLDFEQILLWNGSTEQNIIKDLRDVTIFKEAFGRFDNFNSLYTYGVTPTTPTLIRTSINCPNTDIIVLNFLAATGITDTIIESGLDVFINTLRANNLLVKCKAIYPFVGGTAFTHKFNLLNPLDSDAAFRLTFFGGWTHNSNGVTPNGINAYANTHFTESVNSAGLNDKHISIYSRINLLGQWTDMAAYNGTNAATDISPRFFSSGERCLVRNSNVSGSNYLNNNSHGLFINNRIDSGNVRIRQNATLVPIASPSVALVNVPYYIGANNLNGTAGSFSIRNLAFADIGNGFTDAESLIYYNAVQALQTTLSRQV